MSLLLLDESVVFNRVSSIQGTVVMYFIFLLMITQNIAQDKLCYTNTWIEIYTRLYKYQYCEYVNMILLDIRTDTSALFDNYQHD
jgi:hypothetical protein